MKNPDAPEAGRGWMVITELFEQGLQTSTHDVSSELADAGAERQIKQSQTRRWITPGT